MKCIITSTLAIHLAHCLSRDISLINTEFTISDFLPKSEVFYLDSLNMIDYDDKPMLVKEQSWTKLNKGKFGKKSRREHR